MPAFQEAGLNNCYVVVAKIAINSAAISAGFNSNTEQLQRRYYWYRNWMFGVG